MSSSEYSGLNGSKWILNSAYSQHAYYNENIPAAYATTTAKLGRWSIVGGLRAEYTYSPSHNLYKGQNYINLFPNLNVAYALKADGSYSLVAQYSRTISRPNFWSLDPTRMQISDYTYQIGNPALKPTIQNKITLTSVFAYKYTITLLTEIVKNEIQMNALINSDNICYTYYNFAQTVKYGIVVGLPFTPAKWCNINVNLTDIEYSMALNKNDKAVYRNMFIGNFEADFTLPRKWIIEASYDYQSKATAGNLTSNEQHLIGLSLKKRLLDDKLTISAGVSNLLNQKQHITAQSDEFTRTTVMRQMWSSRIWNVNISYRFDTGKKFRQRTVESGAAEASSRM